MLDKKLFSVVLEQTEHLFKTGLKLMYKLCSCRKAQAPASALSSALEAWEYTGAPPGPLSATKGPDAVSP